MYSGKKPKVPFFYLPGSVENALIHGAFLSLFRNCLKPQPRLSADHVPEKSKSSKAGAHYIGESLKGSILARSKPSISLPQSHCSSTR